MKIGIRAGTGRSIGTAHLRTALLETRRLGAAGIELSAAGELAPARMTQTARRELRHLLRSHDLELTALTCPLRHGLDVSENQEARIDYLKQALSLAYDLGARPVLVQAGKIPKPEEVGHGLLTEALQDLARHGDRVGAILALESGLDSGTDMNAFLERFDTGSLGVNFNPGNLLLSGYDPQASAGALAQKIVHAHACDARTAAANRMAQNVPLGQGDIDWLGLVGVFEEIGYRGWMVVDRENASSSIAFLRRMMGTSTTGVD